MAEMPQQLAASHFDGYRISATASQVDASNVTRLRLAVCLLQGNTIQQTWVVWTRECDDDSLAATLPAFRRLEKLLAAFVRFFNEGGTTDVVKLLADVADCVTTSINAELVASESEETHARTFLLPDGNYLHIVEDDYSEVCTPAEMQAAVAREEILMGDDDLGLSI